MSRSQGLVAAVLAYASWGLLAPAGKILLESTGPFTLNTLRTAGALVAFLLLFGPRRFFQAARRLATDRRLWILGVFGLGLTFGAYLLSVKFLEPTIAALTIFLAPILITWGARARLGEALPPFLLPTLALTILGGILAVLEPFQGVRISSAEVVGLGLGLVGVAGWTFYTLYLKHLGDAFDDVTLTVATFLGSGLAFLLIALPAERLAFPIEADFFAWLGLYILFPSVISFHLYALAVRKAGASIVSILLGIELASTAVLSYFLIQEPFSADKIVGVLLVLLAVTGFLVAAARAERQEPATAV